MKNLFRQVVQTVFCILLLVGCSTNETQNKSSNSTTSNSLRKIDSKSQSGQDIFKCIFFGLGKDLQEMQQLKFRNNLVENMTPNERLSYTAKIDELINIINIDEPEFFNRFKNEITSKSNLRVQTEINRTVETIYPKLALVFPEIGQILQNNRQNMCDGTIGNESDGGNINKYIREKIDTTNAPNSLPSFGGLLENNIISTGSNRPCSFGAIACVAAYYFAVVAHNTLALSAIVGVYLARYFWGPSIQQAATRRPAPTLEDVPESTSEANLRYGMLINEITLFYA